MSFTPISGGFSTALSGAVEPTKFLDVTRSSVHSDDEPELRLDVRPEGRSDIRFEQLATRRIHSPASRPTETMRYTIVLVIISAIIFVTVVALYDVIRSGLNAHFANLALTDPNSHNTPEDIERTQIANQNAFWASVIFATICLIIGIILIFLLLMFLNRSWT